MQRIQQLNQELITRETYNTFFRLISALPNPDSILRRSGKTIDSYRELKNDPHLWSCIQSRKSGVLSLDYSIIPNGTPHSIVQEIEKMFEDLDLQQVERDMLEAPLFGFQPLEIVWKNTVGTRKFIVPSEIVGKPQEWFFFDSSGNLKFKKAGNSSGVEIPPIKMLDVRYEASYINPYGHSLLSKCYWPVTFKKGGLRFWVNFTEKYGMPILMGQYTRGATLEESQKLANELAEMTEDAVIVAPSDIKLELHEAVRSTSVALFYELIKYCNAEISKAILSQTLTTEIDSGSYAASLTHFKIRREVILSDIRLVENAFDKLIRYICDLNFGTKNYPLFKISINDSENMLIVDRDLKLAQTGQVRFTKKYWTTNYGFKDDEIEVV